MRHENQAAETESIPVSTSELTKTSQAKLLKKLASNEKELDKQKEKKANTKEAKNKQDKLANGGKPFKCLGFDCGCYFLMSMTQLQVLKFKANELNQNNLLQLADLSWWLDRYPVYTESGIGARPDWTNAVNDIIQGCTEAGVYSSDAIRGRGFWKDGKTVIRHLGDHLSNVRTNEKINMLSPDLEGIYQRSGAVNFPNVPPATDDQINRFLSASKRIYWGHESHSMFYVGWAALAPLCGLLTWRSHLWISGEHGCGKSDTALDGLSVALGKNQHIHAKDSTTEAGLRQTVKADAIPFILDEMEPNDNKDRGRIDRILSLARNASSDDEAVTLKGSITGDATSYRVRSMFCYASINVHLPELADKSRCSILDIIKKPQTEKSKADFEFIKRTWLELDREDFGYSLTNLMISRLKALSENLKTFIEVAGDILGSARDGKQYGTLLAGFYTIKNRTPATKEQANLLINSIKMQSAVDENRDTDATGWNECWAKIAAIQLSFRTINAKVSVSEALDMMHHKESEQLAALVGLSQENFGKGQWVEASAKKAENEIKTALRNLGIIYQNSSEALHGIAGTGVYLANNSEILKKALNGTAFESWTQYTKRVGESSPKPIKMGGGVNRAKFIQDKDINL